MSAGAEQAARVELRGVDYAFGEGEARRQVLFGVDLALAPGEFAILTGPSGSGKTTLLSLIGSLRRPQAGRLTALGEDLHALRGPALERQRRRIGFVFQLHNLFPALSASESVQLALDLFELDPAEKRARVRAMLARVGLAERAHYKPERLSGGQRQRVAIARALVHAPELVLADEPTAALDRESAASVLALLREQVSERGAALLMVTQDSRVFASADRVIRLVEGRIEADLRGAELAAQRGSL